MANFICVSDSEKKYGRKRALYYDRAFGRKRMYRSGYPEPDHSVFRLLVYKKQENAQAACDTINNGFNDDFKVIEVTDEQIEEVRQNVLKLKQAGEQK